MNTRAAVLWSLSGVLAINLVFGLAQGCVQAPAPTIMPAAGGAITDLGLQFSRHDGARFLEVYRQLFAELDPAVTVHVVVGEEADRELFDAAVASWGAGPRVRTVVAGRPITNWMRDRLAVLEGGSLLAPPAPMVGAEARVNDWQVPWNLAEGRTLPVDVSVRTAAFQFEGGDLIADGSHVFIAPPLLGRNPDLSTAEVLDRVAAETGLEPVLLGTTGEVPDHHIGMFLTPLGEGRVAVADADLGLRAVGHADAAVAGDKRIELDHRGERVGRFRRVADELRAAGFEVIPIPILPAQERYVMFSANNAVLERRDGQLHVYLPSYDSPRFDAAAERAWEDAGAVVHPIDVSGVFQLGGSVRCLTAPLLRR